MGIYDDSSASTIPQLSGTKLPQTITPSPIGLPSASDAPIWLLPDGSVSYTGRPATPAGATAADPSPGFLASNAQTLMALGAGIAQGGVGRGLQLASAAAQASHQQQAHQQSLLHTYDALTDAGVPRTLARAAVYDPHIMRAVASAYFGPKAQNAPAGATAVNPAQPSPADTSSPASS
jgi:hypothetical protein